MQTEYKLNKVKETHTIAQHKQSSLVILTIWVYANNQVITKWLCLETCRKSTTCSARWNYPKECMLCDGWLTCRRKLACPKWVKSKLPGREIITRSSTPGVPHPRTSALSKCTFSYPRKQYTHCTKPHSWTPRSKLSFPGVKKGLKNFHSSLSNLWSSTDNRRVSS